MQSYASCTEKNKFLNRKSRRFTCNYIFPLVNQTKNKKQATQNTCIHFYLKCQSRQPTGLKEFEELTYLAISKKKIRRMCCQKNLNIGRGLHHSI